MLSTWLIIVDVNLNYLGEAVFLGFSTIKLPLSPFHALQNEVISYSAHLLQGTLCSTSYGQSIYLLRTQFHHVDWSLFPHLFIQSLIYGDWYGLVLYFFNPMLLIYFFDSNSSTFDLSLVCSVGCYVPLAFRILEYVGVYVCVLGFEHFLTFWSLRCSRLITVYSLPPF